MLLSKTTPIKWNSNNKKRYISLGYKFTKMGDPIDILIEDLPNGSHAPVLVKCDYCGEEYFVEWCSYTRRKNDAISKSDCCGKKECTGEKASDSLKEKYGVSNCAYIPESVEKRKRTNLNKYGVENVFANEDIKEKIRKSNFEKYGVDYPVQSKEVQKKIADTCTERYGVSCFLQRDYNSETMRGENNPRWNYNKSDAERVSERHSYEYKTWRTAVFDRDGYKCVRCGGKGSTHGLNCRSNGLNAHHILNYADHEDKRYSVSNGVTLCNDCHNEFHKQYGFRNNNEKQLLEFLNDYKGEKIC